jgi:YkoY family integral membrane protein
MFGQTFDLIDLGTIGILILLEGVLSIDNAVVLSLLARRLPERLRGKALSYGLAGSLVLRVLAVALAAYLLQWRIVQLLGGLYLLYVAIRHFLYKKAVRGNPEVLNKPANAGFWRTVAAIELTDAAFAVDSILAAIALVGAGPVEHGLPPKLWVIITGGMLGVILMRFAAAALSRLMERFPRFELSGYLIVLLIGLKLILSWAAELSGLTILDFQDYRRAEFWIFWLLMLACVGVGLAPKRSCIHSAMAPQDTRR